MVRTSIQLKRPQSRPEHLPHPPTHARTRPPAKDHKKGADTGIDGTINFFDDKSGQAKQVIVQVKSGYIGPNHVRDLKGVIEREKAALGALITLREPTICS